MNFVASKGVGSSKKYGAYIDVGKAGTVKKGVKGKTRAGKGAY